MKKKEERRESSSSTDKSTPSPSYLITAQQDMDKVIRSIRPIARLKYAKCRALSTNYIGSDHPYVIRSPAPDIVIPSPTPNYNDFITKVFLNQF
jgi:hypothetical protein